MEPEIKICSIVLQYILNNNNNIKCNRYAILQADNQLVVSQLAAIGQLKLVNIQHMVNGTRNISYANLLVIG